MAKDREIARVEIRDWPGLVTHADRQDIAPGSGRIQVNLQSDRPGALRVRRGLSLVQFDARGLVEVTDVISVQEAVSAFLENRFASTSDSITLGETVNATQVYIAAVSNAVTVTEALALDYYYAAVVSNAVTITESTTVVRETPADVMYVGNQNDNLFWLSGTFSTTVRASQSVNSVDTFATGISWDGTNTPWSGRTDDKLYLQSGQFSSTVKTSIARTGSTVTDVSWDGTNTPWCGNATSFEKLYLQSGQFNGVLKTSLAVVSGGHPYGISWDGTNTPWCGNMTNTAKLMLQSGHFASTLKTSQSVESIMATNQWPEAISWNNTNTLWCGTSGSAKLFLTSGQFTSTIKTSVNVSLKDNAPQGIETNNVSGRIS